MYMRNPMSDSMTSGMQPETFPPGGDLPLAMAYVAVQPQIAKVYYPDAALKQGTLFPELDKPFLGSRGVY